MTTTSETDREGLPVQGMPLRIEEPEDIFQTHLSQFGAEHLVIEGSVHLGRALIPFSRSWLSNLTRFLSLSMLI
jgi:hypothetical protein